MKVAINDIKPNPFRHMERYPILRPKVEALKESYKTTTFWDNLVARRVNGEIELAYGHHRLTALEEMFEPDHEVILIERDLTNQQMIQIMARENMDDFGHNISVTHETVRAVVQALADGDVVLELPELTESQKPNLRYAPEYRRMSATVLSPAAPPEMSGVPYTAEMLGEFLGWMDRVRGEPKHKLLNALNALEYINSKILSEENFLGLGVEDARIVIRETQKAANRHKNHNPRKWGSEVGRKVASAIQDGTITYKGAAAFARKIDPVEPTIPDINILAKKLAGKFTNLFDVSTDKLTVQLEEVIDFKKHLDPAAREDLTKTLMLVSSRAAHYSRQLEMKQITQET